MRFALHDDPILLEDVDRLLEEIGSSGRGTGSDVAGPAGSPPAPREAGHELREWRDDLTAALQALTAAGEILSADVALLRECPLRPGDAALVDRLPRVLAARPWGRSWSTPAPADPGGEPLEVVLRRARPLMTAHEEMARTNLSSAEAVARLQDRMEAQLVALTERRGAVEARLAEIRAAIVREWVGRMSSSLEAPA